MAKLDLTKPVQTRDGRKVRIYATDGGKGKSIHGAVFLHSGQWEMFCWRLNGMFYFDESECTLDLVNVPETFELIADTRDGMILSVCSEKMRLGMFSIIVFSPF